MTRPDKVWHWCCVHCADVIHVATWFRIDGHRSPAKRCCYCLARPPEGVLEAKGRPLETCSCSETS